MAYGYPTADSKVRLDYSALKAAIIAKGNRGKKGQVQCSYHVWAHLMPDDTIVLRLYKTDIITFHANGDRVLRTGMWNTPLTKHWMSEARIDIVNFRPNEWTEQQWFYVAPNGGPMYLFYDGLTIDEEGKVKSKLKPITKNVPNAEAKELRKQMLKVYNTDYLPHLHMLGACDNWKLMVKEWKKTFDNTKIIHQLTTLGLDPLLLIAHELDRTGNSWRQTRWKHDTPEVIFKSFVDREYKYHVIRMRMFDVVPHQPK